MLYFNFIFKMNEVPRSDMILIIIAEVAFQEMYI